MNLDQICLMDKEICVSNMKKDVAFYKYKGSGNHSHGVILIIFKWIAFFPIQLPREKSDIALVFQDGGVNPSPVKFTLKYFY